MEAAPMFPEIQEIVASDDNHPLHDFTVIYPQQVEWGDMDSFGHVNNVVKKIGNSSLIHEYTYYSTVQKTVVAIGESVLVYLDKLSGQKKPIDESQKEAIAALENIKHQPKT